MNTYADEYQLMLDKMDTPYDGTSIMSPRLGKYLYASIERREEMDEALLPSDDSVRKILRKEVEAVWDEVIRDRLQPDADRIENSVIEAANEYLKERFGLTPEVMGDRIREHISEHHHEVISRTRRELDDMLNETKVRIAGQMEQHAKNTVHNHVVSLMESRALQKWMDDLRGSIDAYFKEAADKFIRENIGIRAQPLQTNRKIIT